MVLIEAGGEALLLKTDKKGCSCLYAACQEGHVETVKALIQAGGEALLLKTDKKGFSCLHIACRIGHVEVAKALIQAGGEVLLLGEMVCNDCSQSLMVTSSTSFLLLFEESAYATYLVSSGKS